MGGSPITGYRVGYSGDDYENSYGTAFKAVDDFYNYDAFDTRGRVAFGQSNQLSFDIDAFCGGGWAGNYGKVTFLGGDFGNYWYNFSGDEFGYDIGFWGGVSLDFSAEIFVAVYKGGGDSPSPLTLEGDYSSAVISFEGHEGIGGGIFINYSNAGLWDIYSFGVSAGLGLNAKLSYERRGGKTLIHFKDDIKPTSDRTVYDFTRNKIIHSTLFY